MGASGWSYVTPWRGSIEETMAALQSEVFAEYFSTWPQDRRPADIAELWSGDERDEDTWAGFMGAQGTHTILDVRGLVPPDTRVDYLFNTMRPVPVAEIIETFGHDKPTRAEYEQLGDASPLLDDDGSWTGRCLVLYQNGLPEAVAFWGSSGD
ncbi:hypothetical protein [Catenulispora subtropica]|uniref:Uncharacterized protein n=1 Tax=Catenulispora subtropica TaxID=450798 RepID=A0ABP5EB17_9ACTN